MCTILLLEVLPKEITYATFYGLEEMQGFKWMHSYNTTYILCECLLRIAVFILPLTPLHFSHRQFNFARLLRADKARVLFPHFHWIDIKLNQPQLKIPFKALLWKPYLFKGHQNRSVISTSWKSFFLTFLQCLLSLDIHALVGGRICNVKILTLMSFFYPPRRST